MSVRKKISIQELRASIDNVSSVFGATDGYIFTAAPLDDSNDESISFCSDKTENAKERIKNSRAKVIICYEGLKFTREDYRDRTLILVPDPKLAFVQVLRRYFEEKVSFGISPTAVINKDASIHPNVYIGPHTCIGRCEIGEGTAIHGNVHIYSNVKIKRNVVINAGTVIGAEGIMTTWDVRFPHMGGVVIEDDVWIGSNVSIMRGMLRDTVIGQGSTIGHLCNIGHEASIGKHCFIVSQSMIGGHSLVGDFAHVSLCACVRDKIRIGTKAFVGMGAVVTKDVGDRWVVFGVPAKKVRETQ